MDKVDGNTCDQKVKRKRSANWDNMEKNLLKRCMNEFVSIIENKNTDTNTNKSKTVAWQALSRRFNELNSRDRDIAEIKQQWRAMKLDAKKNMSQVQKSIKCTGGGPKPASPNPEAIEIWNMIPQEFEIDNNVFDSDGIASKKEESRPSTSTQEFDFILTPVNTDSAKEKIIPSSSKPIEPITLKPSGTKRKFNNRHKPAQMDESVIERNKVLVNCLKEEHDLKMKNMIKAHGFVEEEHNLRRKHKLEAHNLFKEETKLRMEKLNLEILLLKSQVININNDKK